MQNFQAELLFRRHLDEKNQSYFLLSSIIPAVKDKDINKACKKIGRHFERRGQDRGRLDRYLGIVSIKPITMINHSIMLLETKMLQNKPPLQNKKFNLGKKINFLGWFVCEALFQTRAQSKVRFLVRTLVYCSSLQREEIIEEVSKALSKKAMAKTIEKSVNKDKCKFKDIIDLRPVYQGIYLNAFDKRKLDTLETSPMSKAEIAELKLFAN